MAKGFKHGGGGGAALNFTVVGGTEQPARAKENTIWVNTEAEITSWVFSATEPTEPNEGMVWIKTSGVSSIWFNALKKNEIQVYPVGTLQYTGGAWVDKVPKIYQNGTWNELILWLYNYGDECLAVTGQWIAEGMSMNAQYPNKVAPNVTRNEDSIKITGVSGVNGGVFYAKNKINLTGFKELVFEGTISHKDSALQIWTEFGSYTSSNVVAKTETAFTDSTVSIPVADLDGEYIIGFKFYSASSVTMKSLKLI